MLPGDVVQGRFRVEAEAGSGGLGVVYKCEDLKLGGSVALKVLDRAAARHRDRFLREAEVLASVIHPAVIRYIAHGVLEGGAPFLVMQWVTGEDLGQRLERQSVTLEESLAIGGRVAAALGAAHQKGIVHRDVKPANILLPNGDPRLAILIDFGIARAGPARMTVPGGVLGTPGYMAPEQARGDADVDERADVFSLGCVLFECVSGKAAFDGDSTMAILAKVILEPAPSLDIVHPGLPNGLGALVSRMLAKLRDDRPSNGMDVLRELEVAAGGVPRAPIAVGSSPRRLTTREQRIFSIIVARLGRAARPGDTLVDALDASEVRSLSKGSANDLTLDLPANVEAVRGAATGLGSRVEVLLDGSLIVLVEGEPSATDQAARAARCAIQMREVCDARTRIVVATGRGELAGQLPVGEVIDRTFRLLEHEETKGIRIDPLTASLVEGRFVVESDVASAFLVDERTDDSPRMLLGKKTSCVGREAEVGALIALFDECREERTPRIALMTGDAGIGKSRVRAELVSRLRERNSKLIVLAGGGDPARSGAPFGILRQALRRMMAVDDDEPIDAQGARIRASVAQFVEPEQAERCATMLAQIMGVSFPSANEELEPQSSVRGNHVLVGDAMRTAWQDLVQAMGRTAPVVVILDDLHWGDRPSLDFVLSAAKALPEVPLFVLASGRNEARATFAELLERTPMTQISLAPLSRRACEKLAREVLGEVDAALIDRLTTQSGGNAFLLEELLRAQKEGRGGSVPETVLAMAQSRIDALAPPVRRAARAASVLGDDASDEGLAALLGCDDRAAADLATQLVKAELMVRRTGNANAYEFKHGLFRDAAYASLTAEDRVLAHALAGDWLEKRPLANPVALAMHFENANEPKRASEPYLLASIRALEGNDLAGAIDRAERALECGAEAELRGRILCLLADVHRWRGEHVKCLERATQANKILRVGSREWVLAQVNAANSSVLLGDINPALATMSTLSLALEAGDRAPHVIEAAARVSGFLTVHRASSDALTKSLARFRKLVAITNDDGLVAIMQTTLAADALARGDVEESLDLTTDTAIRFARAGDARNACRTRLTAGYELLELGQFERAVDILREGIVAGERLGLMGMVAMGKHNLGPCLFETGDVEGGLRVEEEAIKMYAAQNDIRLEGGSRYYLATMLARLSRFDEAEKQLRLAISGLAGVASMRVVAEATLARVLLAQGKQKEGLVCARAASAPPEPKVRPEIPNAVRVALLEALMANGLRDEAKTVAASFVTDVFAHLERVRTPAYRESALKRVHDNARIIAIAEELGLEIPK